MSYYRIRRNEMPSKTREGGEPHRQATKEISVTEKNGPSSAACHANVFYHFAGCHFVVPRTRRGWTVWGQVIFQRNCFRSAYRASSREFFLRSSCLVPHLITWHHDYMGTNATAGDRKDHRRTSKLQTVLRDAFYSGKTQVAHETSILCF